MTSEIRIRNNLQPGDLGLVTMMHGRYYGGSLGYNHVFEAYVAESLAEFGKQYDPQRNRLWIAERDDHPVGSIGLLARADKQSQLRWLLVDETAQGSGLGKELLERCIRFAAEAGHSSIFLWTVDTLAPAAALYKRYGFNLVEQLPPSTLWGPELVEQRYELSMESVTHTRAR